MYKIQVMNKLNQKWIEFLIGKKIKSICLEKSEMNGEIKRDRFKIKTCDGKELMVNSESKYKYCCAGS